MKLDLNRRRILSTGVAAAVIGLVGAVPTQAAETIKLTAMDGYPAKAMWVKEFINYFIPEVDKALAAKGNYKIEWQQAWGGTIVKKKGVLEGLKLGLGDIGVVTTVFHNDKLPLQAIAYVTPFVTVNPKLVAQTVDGLVEKYPAYRAAFAAQNQVYLTNAVVLDTYQMFANKPLNGLADFKGIKVAGAGYNLRYLEGLGAAGVGGSLVTYYNKLKTGVVDAAMIWPEAAVTFKIFEVAPHMLDANIGTVNSKAITMNADSWKKLPPEVQGVIKEVAVAYRDHVADVASARASKSIEKFKANGGTVVKLSDAERVEWAKTMPNIAIQWADGLEKKGIPGRKILSDYMATLKAAGETPVRDWAAEGMN